jgi:hypothetical protein
MSKLWLMYDKKDRMVQRVTKNKRHKIKYLTQTSFLAHENKIKSYSSCLCAFMGLNPVVTALFHNSKLCIYILHNLYFNNNNYYYTIHQMSIVYKSCYCLNMNTNFNFMPKKLMLQTFQLTCMQQTLLGCW